MSLGFVTFAPNKGFFSVAFVRWVTESNTPFQIVNDPSFQMLMKTGRPDCYILSAEMLFCNVKKIFVCVHRRISRMLKV